jgi:hypothetical protein
MEELSTPQMIALRGGAGSANVISISFGNVALAMPIDIILFSGNAVGPGAQAGFGNIIQTAQATAGTQLVNLLTSVK